ncbi:hypothetical protein EN784_01455 [bacterium M00.F.Ca.ET.141.01.1.1]|nr:hypothetical protein EN784_01455 [bacterium M00.F.Ca.ET.141.01.1.1]
MEKLKAYLAEERGRATKLAVAIGVSPSAISMWDQVPADRVGAVSKATGIPPHELRADLADIFGAAPERAA